MIAYLAFSNLDFLKITTRQMTVDAKGNAVSGPKMRRRVTAGAFRRGGRSRRAACNNKWILILRGLKA
jgi:hypothetical protein